MQAIFKANASIQAIWSSLTKQLKKESEVTRQGYWIIPEGKIFEAGYTGELGTYFFRDNIMIFTSHVSRLSLRTGSDCIRCYTDYITLTIGDVKISVKGEWELLESSTPERGIFASAESVTEQENFEI